MNKHGWIKAILISIAICCFFVIFFSIATYYAVSSGTVRCISSDVISEGVSDWYAVIEVQSKEQNVLFSESIKKYEVYYIDEYGYQQVVEIPDEAFNIKINEAENRICRGERIIRRTYEYIPRETFAFEIWLKLLPGREKTWTVDEKHYWYVYEGVPQVSVITE